MHQTSTNVVQDSGLLVRKGDILEIVEEIETSPCYQMIYEQARICPREYEKKFERFYDEEGLLNLRQEIWQSFNNLMDFAVPVDFRMKTKESK